jgi:hypothetical protein
MTCMCWGVQLYATDRTYPPYKHSLGSNVDIKLGAYVSQMWVKHSLTQMAWCRSTQS